eukprot:9479520-Pyramimonas_sp.AAC.1
MGGRASGQLRWSLSPSCSGLFRSIESCEEALLDALFRPSRGSCGAGGRPSDAVGASGGGGGGGGAAPPQAP